MIVRDFGALALAACGVATGRMGWQPADFWGATPVEWVTAVRGRMGEAHTGGSPLASADLARLLQEMPDG